MEINNFQEEFEGDWSKVRERVDKIGRTNEKASVVTAHVHLVVNDPAVKELKGHAFFSCANLARLDLPHVEEVGGFATASSYALRHVTVRSDVKVAPNAFAYCLSLEVLADACDFVTRGKKTNSGRNNATTGITQYLHWRKQMDENKQNYYTLITMLKLCNSVKKNSLLGWLGLDLPMRATSEDSVMRFLIAAGDDIADSLGSTSGLLPLSPSTTYQTFTLPSSPPAAAISITAKQKGAVPHGISPSAPQYPDLVRRPVYGIPLNLN